MLFRIGILEPKFDGWTAGPKYIRTLTHCLVSACKQSAAELFFFSERETEENRRICLPFDVHRVFAREIAVRGEQRVREFLGLRERSRLYYYAQKYGMSVVVPCTDVRTHSYGLRMIGWIPDFQHVYLPQLFSEENRQYRDTAYRRVAQQTQVVMLSSHIASEHFSAFVPEYAYKARVFQFPSTYAFEHSNGNPSTVLEKFRLPAKFVLIANQFWQHKNHLTVIDALQRLSCQGVRIPLVMTGLPADYRDPTNEHLSRILQAVASSGLTDQVTILGMVPEADLHDLLRCAALIIQPSRFEGWSTSVQDAKALGRPLLCSDIPVHHEQVPGALGFFPCDNADILGDLLARVWNRLNPGPEPENEQKALAAEREFAESQGRLLLNLCLEAAASRSAEVNSENS